MTEGALFAVRYLLNGPWWRESSFGHAGALRAIRLSFQAHALGAHPCRLDRQRASTKSSLTRHNAVSLVESVMFAPALRKPKLVGDIPLDQAA